MRSRLMGLIVIALPVLASLEPNLLNAQTTASGSLIGTVTDPSDHVVPGANVELKDNHKGTLLETRTDSEGTYLFSFLLPGSYTVIVSRPGFTTAIVPVNVLLGPPPGTLNIKIAIAPVATTLTVAVKASIENADNGDASATMTEQQISEIPNPGNDLTYIAQTAPGVVMNTDQGGITLGNFSSLGMPGYSNLFTVNGMNSNDMGYSVNMAGASFMLLGQNQIEEATVVLAHRVHGNLTHQWKGADCRWGPSGHSGNLGSPARSGNCHLDRYRWAPNSTQGPHRHPAQ